MESNNHRQEIGLARLAVGETTPHLRDLRAILDERQVTILFQPIVDARERRIHGFEALVRGPSDSPLHAPGNLFEAAHRYEMLLELERLCWCEAYRRFLELDLPGKLFLNTTPVSLLHRGDPLSRHLREIDGREAATDRLVIEVTEQYPIDDYEAVRSAIEHYRGLGFEIAIDDLGAGYSGLRLWSELRPDYVKIDRHFLQGIHEDLTKQEFVRSINDIALGTKSRVIAEGVETRKDFLVVCQLGIDIAQGYYFARPTQRPVRVLDETLFLDEPAGMREGALRLSETVAALAVEVQPIAPQLTVQATVEILQTNPELHTLPVVVEGRPLGVVRRSRLMEIYLRQYGRELHGRKPIQNFMDTNPVVVADNLPVERVSQKITDKLNFELEHDFVVTRDSRYFGMGRVRDLLKTITELQIRNARYANPLTLLPGNVPIYERIDRLLGQRRRFTVGYCDLDNFKPFNDAYGYSLGDDVIRTTARVLSANADVDRDFVGHIGGDDFIVVFTSEDWHERCERILHQFAREVEGFYRPEDVARGGIWSHDRSGKELFFPLLSLSIGAVQPDPQRCRTHHDVAALASDAKHGAKERAGNSLYFNRRQGPPEPPSPAGESAAPQASPLPI